MLRSIGSIVAVLATLTGMWPCVSCAEQPVDFLRDVKPILAQRCFRCHSSLEQESNLRLDSVPAILKGGDGGAAVVPGKSEDSRVIMAVERRGELKMPPEGEPLTAKQIEVLRSWIDSGAPAPTEAAARPEH
jgi:Planctomycete cytochrome C